MLQNLYWKSAENLLIKNFRRSIEEVSLLLHNLRCPGWNFFWNLIIGECGIRMSWVKIFRKINQRGGLLLETWEYVTRGMEGSKRCTECKWVQYVFLCFCLVVSCFICRNLTLSSFKKDVFVRNGYFSSMRSISVVMK